jgi:hypothetical protein
MTNDGDGIVFERSAPVVPVRDLDAAVERYRRPGFTARAYAGPEATVHRVGSRLAGRETGPPRRAADA